MTTTGARKRLITEMRRIGPHCLPAVDYLGLSLEITELPGGAIFSLDFDRRILRGPFPTEWHVWVGLAAFISLQHQLDVDVGMLYDAAAVMCRRSGVINIKIA